MRSEGPAILAPLREVLTTTGRPASASCELPACYEAVCDARRFTRDTLLGWGLSGLLDDVALVASELVTNALRHGVAPGNGDQPISAASPTVRLSLARWTSRLVCSVRDPSSEGPVAKTPDFVAESGRGLHLVASCSEVWGWHPLAGAGKVVWALFPATSD